MPEPVSTPAKPPAIKAPVKATPAPAKTPPVKTPPVKVAPAPAPEPTPEPAFNEFSDLASLVEAANDPNDEAAAVEAANQLKAQAFNAGYTQEDIDAAPDWQAVADMIGQPKGDGTDPNFVPDSGTSEADAEPEAEEGLKVGDVFKYQPMDAKTKKPKIHPTTKKPVLVEVEVKAVHADKEAVDILNLEDNKTTYKNVPWDRLVGE